MMRFGTKVKKFGRFQIRIEKLGMKKLRMEKLGTEKADWADCCDVVFCLNSNFKIRHSLLHV